MAKADYEDPRFFEHLERLGMTVEEYHEARGSLNHLSKNKKPTNLPPWAQGQFGSPEILAKANATRQANAEKKRKQREVLETGFGKSKLSDPEVQATLLDMLTDLALSGDQKSMKMLIDMNAIKMPSLKPEDETTADSLKDLMAPDAAMAILKENAKKG